MTTHVERIYMEKKQRNGLLAAMAITSMTAVAAIAAFAKAEGGLVNPAEASGGSKTISGEQFANLLLSPIYIDGKENKAFRYYFNSQRYVDGWILYSDCDHQSIVNEDGYRHFVLDNSGEESPNNFNFNVLFNIHGITAVSFEYGYRLTGFDSCEVLFAGVKYASEGENGFNPTEYEIHQLTNYEDPDPEDPEDPEEDPDEQVMPINNGGLIHRHNAAGDPMIWAYTDYWSPALDEEGAEDYESDSDEGRYSLCSIQLNAVEVPPGAVLEMWLTSMTFTYTC